MIVLLDANALIKAPFHQPSWRILGLSGKEWGVELQIPWVSALEAIGHTHRALEDDASVLEGMARRNRGMAGVDQALAGLRARQDSIEDQFVADAEAVGASLIHPVEVTHLEMVRRQTARRKPCKPDGNGYRDTLNWLTVLAVAAANPDREIVWVSEDGDFNGKDKQTLHQDLLAEAKERGVGGQITLRASLHSVVAAFLTEHNLPANLNEVRKSLVKKAIQAFVLETVLPTVVDIEPALELTDIRWPDADAITVGEPTGIDDGGAAWEFTADLQVRVGSSSALPADQVTVTGLVTTDRFDKTTGGEINDVALPPATQATADFVRDLEASGVARAFAADLHNGALAAALTKTTSSWPLVTAMTIGDSQLSGLGKTIAALNAIGANHQSLVRNSVAAQTLALDLQRAGVFETLRPANYAASLVANTGISDLVKAATAGLTSPITRLNQEILASFSKSVNLRVLGELHRSPLTGLADQIVRQNQLMVAGLARDFARAAWVTSGWTSPRTSSTRDDESREPDAAPHEKDE